MPDAPGERLLLRRGPEEVEGVAGGCWVGRPVGAGPFRQCSDRFPG